MEKKEKVEWTIKIALYGTYSVGKTSLAKRWVEDVYTNTSPTIGAGFFTKIKEIDGKTIRCQIWDTAGSEKFKSIVPIYLRQAEACLICFDAMDIEGVENMIKFVTDTKPDLRIILVRTKCDICCSIDDPEEFNRWVYSTTYPYYETSSKTGQGVDKTFVDVFKMCMGKYYQENENFDNVYIDAEDLSPSKGGCCIIL